MKKNNGKAGAVLTAVNIVVIVICIAATLLLLFPTAYQWISRENQPIFGRYLYVNTNSSMAPVMEENDIIAVEPMELEKMAVGDFLCYYPVDEEEDGVQFGKIVAIDGDTLSLSDKAGHSVDMTVGEIIVVGKATDKILFLGQAVQFLKDDGNRLLFYTSVAAGVVILLSVTIILHIKFKREQPAEEPQPAAYSLDDLVEVEQEPIEFEKAPKKDEEEFMIK